MVIKSMEAAVVKVVTRISAQQKPPATIINVEASGVHAATLFLRIDRFKPSEHVIVKVKGRSAFDAELIPDPRTLLRESRRTGDRLHPALRSISLNF